MPYDLNAVERGYGECTVDWNGQPITLRYRADLNNRAVLAVKRAAVGVLTLDGKTRFPDVEAIIEELIRVLLPCSADIPEDERGWDIVRGDDPVPITFDELVDLPPLLPQSLLIAVFQDVHDPNRRRPSRSGSRQEGVSQPTVSPTGTDSSKTLNGQASLHGSSQDSLTLVGSGPVGDPGFGV